jgi:hypothetical protein
LEIASAAAAGATHEMLAAHSAAVITGCLTEVFLDGENLAVVGNYARVH